ncbi:MAG TPA: hypothetical protein VFS07_01935 [Gemmatimonadales bacterium]|nr:hypothetical protein [Gemmatimonadales bacterium]
MRDRLAAWCAAGTSRPALLARRALGTALPGDDALSTALHAALASASLPTTLAALAWRCIELMDLGPPPEGPLDRLETLLAAGAPAPLPLALPSGEVVTDAATAEVAASALALRALTKAHRTDHPEVRRALDALARRGPAVHGVVARASALHGIAADAVHYPTAVHRLVDELVAAQRADGGWGEAELFHVAQALLAVEHAGADRALGRGLAALAVRLATAVPPPTDEQRWIATRWVLRAG